MKKLLLFAAICCLQPKNIYELIYETYRGYRISEIDEVRPNDNNPVYFIQIENANNIKWIKVTAENITVLSDRRKM